MYTRKKNRGNWKVQYRGKIEKTSIKFSFRVEKAIKRISIQPKRRQREAYDVILRHFSANLTLKNFPSRLESVKNFFLSSSSFFGRVSIVYMREENFLKFQFCMENFHLQCSRRFSCCCEILTNFPNFAEFWSHMEVRKILTAMIV